jgi:hypothetical protein
MSSPWRHIAAIPLMNAGDHRLSSFDFDDGAHIRVGRPPIIQDLIPRIALLKHVAPWEARHMQLAGGWMWLTSDEQPEEIEEPRNVFAICNELAWKLWSLAWCIDLAGGGENRYWRNGNNMHCAGVYVCSRDMAMFDQFRRPYLYSTPQSEYIDAPWSEQCLSLANRLNATLSSSSVKSIPRLALANDLRFAMATWDARRMRVRFALCCTALETLFISPSEHRFLPDPMIRARIAQACPTLSTFSLDFFERYKRRRNDSVHRAGADQSGAFPSSALTEVQAEVLLREGLVWATMNYETVSLAFENDSWPTPLQGPD